RVTFDQRTRSGRQIRLFDRITMGKALAVFICCFGAIELLAHVEWVRSSFLVDHTIKFAVFAVAVESLAGGLYRLERVLGYDVQPLIDHAYRSGTVGEFWCRYNTRVHAWLDQNVFGPAGGRRKPRQAIFLVFLVSAALHEIGFAIATSRWDGYQMTFFLLQAPAVILGRVFQRVAAESIWGRFTLRGATILWMWTTSMFFFHGVNRVFPFFYASTPWLP
ncbi:MAG: hypothetical protein MI861_15295, partial [Pirellulales bacterium]|nr:hypothetical protein [Pirellulales bacterium]